MQPIITPLNYTYKKTDSDVWVLNTDDIPIDKLKIKDQQLVHLNPKSVGGNHKHPRTEWFIGIGELLFVWQDDQNQQQQIEMHPDGKILLIEVPPYLPHAIANLSKTQFGLLYELASSKMTRVEPTQVYG